MATKVKNINGTGQKTCKCGSWLAHWEKFSRQTTKFCVEVSCIKTDLVGAHVQKANSTDTNWYILPLCRDHNKDTGVVEVSDNYTLVSANVKGTCG